MVKLCTLVLFATSLVASCQLRRLDRVDRVMQIAERAIQRGNFSLLERQLGVSDPMQYVCCDMCEPRLKPYSERAYQKCVEGCSQCKAPEEECVAPTEQIVDDLSSALCAGTRFICSRPREVNPELPENPPKCILYTQDECMTSLAEQAQTCADEMGGDFGICESEKRFKEVFIWTTELPCTMGARKGI